VEEGYDVDSAKSGQEAIEKCIENIYSLILIDVKLPDLKGTQLLTRISDTDPKMRKVVITGYPSLENARHALNLGANAYLTKPVKAEELLETVSKQVSERNKEFSERYSILEGLDSKEKE
jgi:YesN/AraC family two-component response regulator